MQDFTGKGIECIVVQVTLSYELLDDMYASTEWLAPASDGTGVQHESLSEEKTYAVGYVGVRKAVFKSESRESCSGGTRTTGCNFDKM